MATASAFAQTVATPADQALPNREQIERPSPPARPASQVRVDSGRAIASAPCPLENSDVKVTIGKVRFSGPADGPLPAQIAPLLAGIGAPAGEQPVRIICDIRDRAAASLRKAGYIASVQIPPQRIESGELVLQIVTAHIVEVRVRGDAGPYRNVLAGRIAQLKALDPLNEHDAERVLLVTGDAPGLDVQLALRPAGTRPGEVIGELSVSARRFAAIANIQDYGSKQLGREALYSRVSVYGLTGASESFVAGSSTADFQEQQIAQIGHAVGLDRNGTTLAGSFTYAWSAPDLGTLKLTSRSWIGNVALETPLVRSLRRNLTIGGGMEFIEQKSRTPSPLNRDRLRIAFLRAEGNFRTARTDGTDKIRIDAKLEVRKGLALFGASDTGVVSGGYAPSRVQGDPQATVVKGGLDVAIGVGPIFTLRGSARGQWANHPLLNIEEYSIGNMTIGRGYDPGANSADRAIALRGELQAKLLDVSSQRVDAVGFYDFVRIYNLDSGQFETRRNLASYGGGLRYSIGRVAQLDVMYAHPLDRALLIPGSKRATPRLLASFTYIFAPGTGQ